MCDVDRRYGVVEWGHFDQSHDNRAQLRVLRRVLQGQPKRRFVLRVNRDPHATWGALEAYHRKNHGSNWLTSKYLVHNLSAPASVNFKLHCVELFDIAADGTRQRLPAPQYCNILPRHRNACCWRDRLLRRPRVCDKSFPQ
jgi:hypothetical protein